MCIYGRMGGGGIFNWLFFIWLGWLFFQDTAVVYSLSSKWERLKTSIYSCVVFFLHCLTLWYSFKSFRIVVNKFTDTGKNFDGRV